MRAISCLSINRVKLWRWYILSCLAKNSQRRDEHHALRLVRILVSIQRNSGALNTGILVSFHVCVARVLNNFFSTQRKLQTFLLSCYFHCFCDEQNLFCCNNKIKDFITLKPILPCSVIWRLLNYFELIKSRAMLYANTFLYAFSPLLYLKNFKNKRQR